MAGYWLSLVFSIFLSSLIFQGQSSAPSVLKLFSDDDNRNNPLEMVKADDEDQQLLYAVLRVGNLTRTIEFYTACFGMVVFHQVDRPWLRYSYALVGYDSPETNFFLKLIYNYGVDIIDVGIGFGHFGVLTQDANQTVESVVANEGVVDLYPTTNLDGSVTAFVFDPSGYLVEITQPNPANESIIIDHINFRVTNMNRSLEFYERALSLNLIRYYETPDQSFSIGLLSYGQIYKETALELTYVADLVNITRGNGYSHFALSTDDVFKSAKIIRNVTREYGGGIIRPPGRIPGSRIYITAFLDLLGFKIVLLEYDHFFKGSI